MWAVVPIKQFTIAKKRLSRLLSEEERVRLAEVMFLDVITALQESEAITEIVVVSKEPAVKTLVTGEHIHHINELDNDLSIAVTQGGRYIKDRGGDAMLMVPGDVPAVTAKEIDELVAAHGSKPGLTLVSDRDGTGTNGLVVSPTDLMTFSYGVNSFQAHTATAAELGYSAHSLSLGGLSLDIDTADDIQLLLDEGRPSGTLEFLTNLNVLARPPIGRNIDHAVAG